MINNICIIINSRKSVSYGLEKHLIETVKYLSKYKNINIIIVTHKKLKYNIDMHDVRKIIIKNLKFIYIKEVIKNNNINIMIALNLRYLGSFDIPVYYYIQNIEPLQNPEYRMNLIWFLRLIILRIEAKYCLKKIQEVIAISYHVKNQVLKNKYKNNIYVNYHGVDINNGGEYGDFKQLEGESFIFCVGSIVPYRGFEDVIKLMNKLKFENSNIKLCIAGSIGSNWYYKKILKLINNNNTIFLGKLDKPQINWCYKNSYCFIQTSLAEACPNIVLESMSCGSIIISCDHPPMPEIYDGSALIYKSGDVNDLYNKFKIIENMDTNEKNKMRIMSKEKALKYSWISAGENLKNILKIN